MYVIKCDGEDIGERYTYREDAEEALDDLMGKGEVVNESHRYACDNLFLYTTDWFRDKDGVLCAQEHEWSVEEL